MSTPKLGVLLTPEATLSAQSLLETARSATAYELGIWIPEHAHIEGYAASALALAGLVVAAAPGAHVGTAGVIAGARTPLSILRDADVLAAAGNLTLGVVAGWDYRDFANEHAFAARFEALDSVIEAAAAHARRWPLLVGARTVVGVERAARADGWLAPTSLGADDIATLGRDLGGGMIVALRRWQGAAGGTGRTPPDLVLHGRKSVVAEIELLTAAGVNEVVFGPVGSTQVLERLVGDIFPAQ